jgi:hypothetical protein
MFGFVCGGLDILNFLISVNWAMLYQLIQFGNVIPLNG